jgi:NADPH2:quinone reductase
MTNQKALIVPAYGHPVTSTTIPIPQPGPHQLLLRVTVAGLNPHDEKIRDYGLFSNPVPVILSNDVTGVVTATGASVTRFKAGDSVFTFSDIYAPGTVQSGLQEYAIADEHRTAKIPDGFDHHEAATLPVNLRASTVALFAGSGLGIPAPWTDEAKAFDHAGTCLLIIGGGSNCGKLAVQLAKLAGIGKIVVLGGSEEELEGWGATHVLDRHGSDDEVQARIRGVVGDELVYCYDAVNELPTQYIGINALSDVKKGKFVRLIPSGPVPTERVREKKAGYEVKDVLGGKDWSDVENGLWSNIEMYLREGKIVPLKYEVVDGLNVEKVNEVLDRYRDGKRVVRTHFRISH